MHRNAYLRASGQTSKNDNAIRFDDPYFLYQVNNSSVGMHFRYVLAISLVRMRRNSVNSASGLKNALTIVFSDTISYKRTKILAIWQHNKRVLGLFSLRMRRNTYVRASGQKPDLAVRLGDPHFL